MVAESTILEREKRFVEIGRGGGTEESETVCSNVFVGRAPKDCDRV